MRSIPDATTSRTEPLLAPGWSTSTTRNRATAVAAGGEASPTSTPQGAPVRDPEATARLRSLAVPPAWTDVWFCADPSGHIQATGRDAKGRKQYRYHDDWQTARGEAKYEALVDFGHALPSTRARVDTDMRPPRKGVDHDRVVATIVHLLD